MYYNYGCYYVLHYILWQLRFLLHLLFYQVTRGSLKSHNFDLKFSWPWSLYLGSSLFRSCIWFQVKSVSSTGYNLKFFATYLDYHAHWMPRRNIEKRRKSARAINYFEARNTFKLRTFLSFTKSCEQHLEEHSI